MKYGFDKQGSTVSALFIKRSDYLLWEEDR